MMMVSSNNHFHFKNVGTCYKQQKLHTKHIEEIRSFIRGSKDLRTSINTIDSLYKFGIDYHFKEEIKDKMLNSIYPQIHLTDDLYDVSLSFRLLRQSGYPVSSDVLYRFFDKEGRFKASLVSDTEGLMSLYEASQLNTGESILYTAEKFSREQLKCCAQQLELVEWTLNRPFYKTLPKYSSTYYIRRRGRESTIDQYIKDVARVDFNNLQSIYQEELIQVLRWWKNMGLAQELTFIRDEPLKWYTWPMAAIPDPEFSKCRVELTKVIAFIYVIDDLYDVYGSPEELSLFNDAIKKWDISAADSLPSYMRMCYINLYNVTNEIAHATNTLYQFNPIDHLKNSWIRLCDAFMKETKWLRSNKAPSADEYLKNAVISSGVHAVITHAFFLMGEGITETNAKNLEKNPTILSAPATMLRLRDDLGCAKDDDQEGLDGSYVEYLMKENPNYTLECAKERVAKMISRCWEDLSRECFFKSDHLSPNIMSSCLNLARMVEVMYSYDEGHNLPELEDYINTLLFNKI